MADGGNGNRALKIALISTSALATPPVGYGGTELVVAELAERLTELGHRVTVFATGDSTCAGAERCVFDEPVWPPSGLAELRHSARAWKRIREGDFDLVHLNTAEALAFASFVDIPTVVTVHHEHVEDIADHYADFDQAAFVAISKRQAALSPRVPFRSVIHHGVDVDRFPLGPGDGGYCAFLGRFAPEKAPHVAIDVARAAGIPVKLGGAAHPIAKDYFEREVEPRLEGEDAEWLGELGFPRKLKLLAHATAMLFPIQWDEPFGLVMIESMLVGTPVIALARGSAPEVIDNGVTGFVCEDAHEMVARLREIGTLDRMACRERARERFNSMRMAREYAALYRTLARYRWVA